MSDQESTPDNNKKISKMQNLVSIFWPSFLIASLSTMIFFSVFDPSDLAAISGSELSRLAGYTIGFFAFWLMCGLSSILTNYFRRPCDEFNKTTE